MSIIIETERLILRQFEETDAAQLNEICNQEYILDRMPDWKSNLEERQGWIKWVRTQYAIANSDSACVILAVTLKPENNLIGMIGIGNKEEVDNEIEIAYFISEKYCNRGYICEAAKAMTQWAFDVLKIRYLIAIVEIDNFPSRRIAEKCGFEKVETRMILNSGETEIKPFFYYRLYNCRICNE